MQLLYTSDLHGHSKRYRELKHLSHRYHPDVIILGGDLLPHHGHSQSSVQSQIRFIQNDFKRFLSNLPSNTQIGIILGNDDWAAALLPLQSLSNTYPIYLIHDQSIMINGIDIFGYSYVPPTPFLAKDFDKLDKKNDPVPSHPETAFITEHEKIRSINTTILYQKRCSIEEDLTKLPKSKNMIFVAHAPPYQTCLDRLNDGRSVGSWSVRNWIQLHQPLLSLHGHIHESPRSSGRYWDRIGNTISINPGQTENRLSAVTIHINHTIQIEHTIYGQMD